MPRSLSVLRRTCSRAGSEIRDLDFPAVRCGGWWCRHRKHTSRRQKRDKSLLLGLDTSPQLQSRADTPPAVKFAASPTEATHRQSTPTPETASKTRLGGFWALHQQTTRGLNGSGRFDDQKIQQALTGNGHLMSSAPNTAAPSCSTSDSSPVRAACL